MTEANPSNHKTIYDYIRAELSREQPPQIMAATNSVMKRFEGHVAGVLFYGSCLRTGEFEDKILDFYIIVDDYKSAYPSWILGALNKVIPPNVYYDEFDFEGIKIRSKFAVLSLNDYIYRTSKDCLNISVWARFSQPSALVYFVNDRANEALTNATSNAVETMISATIPMLKEELTSRELWAGAFSLTYSAELRSEKPGKGFELYELDKVRYDELTLLLNKELDGVGRSRGTEKLKWVFRRLNGKFVSFMRLLKATFTFDGGIDYLAWKISRHSGFEVEITPWQRKHPILGGVSLFWKLRKKGAFR